MLIIVNKDGKVLGRQRYLCKDCKYRYSVERRSTEKPLEKKKLALSMYLEGLGFRTIGRVLDINFVTIYHWVKKWGASISLPQPSAPLEMVELDEIYTYIRSKKTTAGSGLLLTDLENGSSILFVGTALQKHLKNYGRGSKN